MFRLITVLLLTAMLAFAVRVGEVMTGVRNLSGAAVAEDQKADKKSVASEPVAAVDAKDAEKKVSDKKSDTSETADKETNKDKPKAETANGGSVKPGHKWPDPVDMDPELAEVREGLVKDLAERRNLVEIQEKALTTREALLKATELELDQKYKELTELRTQLQGLLNQQSEEESERIKSLVRIYEGMKPADAARIFNTLDTTVLLDVMTRMSERKSSPILAAMDPDRARTLTLLMAQQKKLPELPEFIAPEAGDTALPAPQGQSNVDESAQAPAAQ